MAENLTVKNLADIYELAPLEWTQIEARLGQGFGQAPGGGGPHRHTCWLATIDPDGRPHVTGVGALWIDGAWWFETGETTRKGRNLARDPWCTLSVAIQEFDVVTEGVAEKVTDPEAVAEIAARYAADGWPAEVDESGTALTVEFSAPSVGPPPWHVYRIVPTKATSLAAVEPGGASSWTFDPE